ncbi:MAG TPA: hypothetical protein PKE49_00385 [Leptospiraceae bacterium]|jgi:hypothetical protein|nr:hypothetical protein [Leptospirales bacterium]HMU82189.1 hypothetical protein [Leptospiraceae bacterium]HMX54946.1 hypothetical protein [Leptospiraceae bacterium]HMY45362.1 hypothetical protein [Leptospiraceae bacterium]HMZ35073.1 hypothetical protein [Leptospiraceae bacterium]
MTFLLEKDFRIGFFAGCALHLWYLIPRVSWLSLKCGARCSDIATADAPISLLYLAFPDPGVIFFSTILGTIEWGVWFYLILKAVRFLVSRFLPS